jgi:hypothetical protein
MNRELEEMASDVRQGLRFQPVVVTLDSLACESFVAVRRDPRRFVPEIFVGDWANTDKHAVEGDMRLLAAVVCDDETIYFVGRQGGTLFACGMKKQSGHRKKKKGS